MIESAASIDIWWIPLDSAPPRAELLSDDERSRLDRAGASSRRREILVGRTWLRQILAGYVAVAPDELRFRYGAHDRPEVGLPGAPSFNLSHSAGAAVAAVGPVPALGVDVESLRVERPFRRLARRFFAPAEREWMESLPEAAVADAFYDLWTLKEAYLKALGTGLSFSSRAFCMAPTEEPPRLAETDYPDDEPGRWRFARPAAPDGYRAAVCWRGPDLRLATRSIDELAGRAPCPDPRGVS